MNDTEFTDINSKLHRWRTKECGELPRAEVLLTLFTISCVNLSGVRLSFDAARLLLRAEDWQVDGWWSKPVLNRPGVFDDIPDPARSFWGVYAVHPLPLVPQGHVDLYYLGFENKDAVYVQGAGYELRNTLGTRLWGAPLPWEYNLEYDWQFGRFGPGSTSLLPFIAAA